MDEPRKTVTVIIPLEQLAGLSVRIDKLAKEATERIVKQETERLRDESRIGLAYLSLRHNASIDRFP